MTFIPATLDFQVNFEGKKFGFNVFSDILSETLVAAPLPW